MRYRKRLIDDVVKSALKISGAVLIEGPKWCGKTTTAMRLAKSELLLGNPEELKRAKFLAINDMSLLLEGKNPKLIDEWQEIPELWDAARSEIDKRGEFGQFIFTGSAVPADSSRIRHSGVGRFSWVKMRPMSLFESGESNGTVGLSQMFDGRKIRGESGLSIQDLAFVTARGGLPASLAVSNREEALKLVRAYVSGIVHADLVRVDGVKRSVEYTERVLRSYARFQGEQVALTEIQKDLGEEAGGAPTTKTIASYHEALSKIFVIEDMAAWNPNLRSKSAIRTSDTRYFVDPAIAVVALDTDDKGLFNDLNTFGFIFETLCMRDLRVYAEALGGSVMHYRDSSGLECDAVVKIPGGKYGLVQVKLGGSEEEIESAVATMNKLEENLDLRKTKRPAFKMVLVGAERVAHQRGDGAYVVPIGCLRN